MCLVRKRFLLQTALFSRFHRKPWAETGTEVREGRERGKLQKGWVGTRVLGPLSSLREPRGNFMGRPGAPFFPGSKSGVSEGSL